MELWSYILSSLSLFTSWQIGRKKAWPWLLAGLQQLLWIAFALVTEQYGFIASAFVFAPLNVYNYVKWRREEVEAREV